MIVRLILLFFFGASLIQALTLLQKSLNRISFVLCDHPLKLRDQSVESERRAFLNLLDYLSDQRLFMMGAIGPDIQPIVPRVIRNHPLLTFEGISPADEEAMREQDFFKHLHAMVDSDPKELDRFFFRLTQTHIIPALRSHRFKLLEDLKPWLERLWTRIEESMSAERTALDEALARERLPVFMQECASNSLLMQTLRFLMSMAAFSVLRHKFVPSIVDTFSLMLLPLDLDVPVFTKYATSELASASLSFAMLDHAGDVPVFKKLHTGQEGLVSGWYKFQLPFKWSSILSWPAYRIYQDQLIDAEVQPVRFHVGMNGTAQLISGSNPLAVRKWCLVHSLLAGNQVGLDFQVEENIREDALWAYWHGVLKIRPLSPSQSCTECKWIPRDAQKLKPCSRCRQAYYCGRECQRKYWKRCPGGCCAAKVPTSSEEDAQTDKVTIRVLSPDGQDVKSVCKETSPDGMFIRLCTKDDSDEQLTFSLPLK